MTELKFQQAQKGKDNVNYTKMGCISKEPYDFSNVYE